LYAIFVALLLSLHAIFYDLLQSLYAVFIAILQCLYGCMEYFIAMPCGGAIILLQCNSIYKVGHLFA